MKENTVITSGPRWLFIQSVNLEQVFPKTSFVTKLLITDCIIDNVCHNYRNLKDVSVVAQVALLEFPVVQELESAIVAAELFGNRHVASDLAVGQTLFDIDRMRSHDNFLIKRVHLCINTRI